MPLAADAGVESSHAPARQPDGARWDACLALRFERVGPRSVLAQREHRGPLVVQKALYPEGPGVCQCVIVHPPAGIVGGDRILLTAAVNAGAHAQLTTPGAARWYRSAGSQAEQTFRARVVDGGSLEWLPQGTIVHEGALARSTTHVELVGDAAFIGAEITALGRRAAGEQFRCGEWRQRFEIVRDGAPIWSERAVLRGGGALLTSAAGLNGAPVFGTLVVVKSGLSDALMPALRVLAPVQGAGSVTRLPHAIVARYVGESMEAAGAYFMAAWSIVRPPICGLAAVRPRIWST